MTGPADLFDEAVRNPGRRQDAMGALFDGLAAAAQAVSDQRQAGKDARRAARNADPQVFDRRSAAARRGWETRRASAREAAQEAAWEDLDDLPVLDGPACGEMNHDGIGRETFCRLNVDHLDEDHDDLVGTTWERED